VQAVQGGRQQLHDAALNLSQAAAEYLTEEHPLLVKPAQVAGFVQQVDTLRDDIARLEQRVARLKSSGYS
jgi:ubiquinone biosynthesis protein UbiJ